MITNETSLQDFITSTVLDAAFRRRKNGWLRTNDDTIQLVNLQKSQWGGQYYLNIGVYLRALGRSTAPKEHECHLRTRLTSLDAPRKDEIEAALDLENVKLPHGDRRRILELTLREVALPFLDQHSTVPQLRRSYRDGRLDRFFVAARAREILSGEGEDLLS